MPARLMSKMVRHQCPVPHHLSCPRRAQSRCEPREDHRDARVAIMMGGPAAMYTCDALVALNEFEAQGQAT